MEEDYKAMQAKALEQLRSGQSLTGKDGAFVPLLKQFIETALAAEMTGHLDEHERSNGKNDPLIFGGLFWFLYQIKKRLNH